MDNLLNEKSRMTRECHVRFCESLAGRFRWATRPLPTPEAAKRLKSLEIPPPPPILELN